MVKTDFNQYSNAQGDMGSKRRGVLTLCAGAIVLAARGSDEAARLLARGSDELLAGAAKSGDDAKSSTSALDDIVNAGSRYYRRIRLETLLSDQQATESFSLPPGSYAGYKIKPTTHTELEIHFETQFGASIDAFVLGREAFEQYESQGKFDGLGVWISFYKSNDAATVTLESDTEYFLLFDHTDAGLAEPVDYDVMINTEVSLGIIQ